MALRSVALLFLVIATPSVYAATHNVGGDSGWTNGGDYTSWASGETFNVGDALVFKYGSSHGVDVVSKDGYDNCNSANALESFNDGSTTVSLTKAGSMYFICPNSFHCGQGMKLAVDVKDSSGSPPSGSTPATPSTPSTPSGSTTPPSSSSPSGGDRSPNSPSNYGGATTGANAATGSFGSMNIHMVLGFSLVTAALVIRA